MSSIERLTDYFAKFPGIGFRQASRFVFFLLAEPEKNVAEFISLIQGLKKEIRVCRYCNRFFAFDESSIRQECRICTDKSRDPKMLMLVCRDTDLETVESSGFYKGHYFVLGGSVPILEKKPSSKIREKELLDEIGRRGKNGDLREIILAMNLNPEGENTADYLEKFLSPLAKTFNLKLSTLGRGLSTGTEIEYSDPDTIKNALKNRSAGIN